MLISRDECSRRLVREGGKKGEKRIEKTCRQERREGEKEKGGQRSGAYTPSLSETNQLS